MSGWDDLVTTALLGTDRRSLPTTLPGPVARLSAAQHDTGLAVLDAAAGYTGYRVAGARPATAPEPPTAPRQRLDLAPEPAQQLLDELLAARDTPLVEEWLRACTARGVGVRSGLWARLATAAAAPSGPDRGLVLSAMGERGRAFVELNPRWRPVLRPASVEAPRPAPPSALLTDRALEAVRVTRSLFSRRVEVRPPVHDEALASAGLAPRPPRGSALRPAAHLLRGVVAGADLDAWEGATGAGPEALLALLHGDAPGWYADLAAALTEATLAQRHRGWAVALLRAGQPAPGLGHLVTDDDLTRVVEGWVGSRADADQVARLLAALPGPWPERVADAALQHLVSRRPSAAAARRLSSALGHAAPVSVLDDVAGRGLPEAEQVLAVRGEIEDAFATQVSPPVRPLGTPTPRTETP
jgi:hypothetical protein